MPLKSVVTGVGAALLFTIGVAAAFADVPSTPAETTTTTTTTTTTDETTTTGATTTLSTPAITTTTSTTTPPTTTTTASTTAPRVRSSPPRRKSTHVSARPAVVAADTPRKDELRSPRRDKKRRRVSRPLEVTPPLGQRHFVFPVVGPAGYGDTYGEFRADVHGKWHHGDDIFAPLGAPVVAVASGTINRVGWRKAGGWRLWVRDSASDLFYYAHLSGYARSVFHSKRVRVGQVIGFVGNTGDAFPGDPHLHFEIHPRQLLSLRYDGAVNPTTYLDSWTHLESAPAARPVHPRLPKLLRFRTQALQDFRKLLVARNLLDAPSTSTRFDVSSDPDRSVAHALPIVEAAAASPSEDDNRMPVTPMLAGLGSLTLGAAAMLIAQLALRRIRQETKEPRFGGSWPCVRPDGRR
jgi:murein DD-endopeptidase MepM/ murein hydrolase activator NlpD